MTPIRTFLACLPLLLAPACHRSKDRAEEAAPRIQGEVIAFPGRAPELASFSVQAVESGEALRERFTGRLAWDENVTVRVFSPVLGRVIRPLADVGQAVAAGGTLALLESPDFGQAQSEATRAEADLQTAERNLSRLRALVEHGAAARKDWENAESDHARAKAEQQRSRARLRLFGGSGGVVDQQFKLKSPLGGTVVDRALNPGQEVRPDLPAPLFIVSDPRRLWVILDVGESQAAGLKPGMELAIHPQALPGQAFAGRLEVVGDALDPATRTLKVRGSIANPKRLLKAEMYVEAEIATKASARIPLLPVASVVTDGPGNLVFVEEGPGRFRRQGVRLGAERNGKVEVLDGLVPGQRVVVDGSLLLQSLMAGKS